MPIYEYKCDEGHVFDAVQGFSEEALTSCTKCGAPARRVLSAPAIHFKGSGFYNTDYGTKSKSRSGEGEGSGEGSGSSDSGESKSSSDSSSDRSGSSKSSNDSGGSSDSSSSAKSAA